MILYGISYSPWSLRAAWVLRHHQIDYTYREYVPMLSTPLLRLIVRDFSGRLTLPILLDRDVVLRDSVEIAKYADDRGAGTTMFGDAEDVVEAWTATANQICEAGRVITTDAVLSDRAAAREALPGFIPRVVRGLATPIVNVGAWNLARKYAFVDLDAAHDQMRAALERVANRLVTSDTLGEQFGWPDVAVCAALQFVEPAADWARLGPATRACWTRAELSQEFADVLAWRDRTLQSRRT